MSLSSHSSSEEQVILIHLPPEHLSEQVSKSLTEELFSHELCTVPGLMQVKDSKFCNKLSSLQKVTPGSSDSQSLSSKQPKIFPSLSIRYLPEGPLILITSFSITSILKLWPFR